MFAIHIQNIHTREFTQVCRMFFAIHQSGCSMIQLSASVSKSRLPGTVNISFRITLRSVCGCVKSVVDVKICLNELNKKNEIELKGE